MYIYIHHESVLKILSFKSEKHRRPDKSFYGQHSAAAGYDFGCWHWFFVVKKSAINIIIVH